MVWKYCEKDSQLSWFSSRWRVFGRVVFEFGQSMKVERCVVEILQKRLLIVCLGPNG